MVWPACRKKCYLTFWNKTHLTTNQNLDNKTKFCRPANQSRISSAWRSIINHKNGINLPRQVAPSTVPRSFFLAEFSTEERIRHPHLSILATPRLWPVASRPSFLGSFCSIKLVLDVSSSYGGERFPTSLWRRGSVASVGGGDETSCPDDDPSPLIHWPLAIVGNLPLFLPPVQTQAHIPNYLHIYWDSCQHIYIYSLGFPPTYIYSSSTPVHQKSANETCGKHKSTNPRIVHPFIWRRLLLTPFLTSLVSELSCRLSYKSTKQEKEEFRGAINILPSPLDISRRCSTLPSPTLFYGDIRSSAHILWTFLT